MTMTLQHIYQYPVKSMGGTLVSSADVSGEGLIHDRRWLITDLKGRFLTARRYPQMLLWQTHSDAQQNLTLTSPSGNKQIVFTKDCIYRNQVKVWQDSFIAYTAPDSVNYWLSSEFDTPCILHYLGPVSQRLLKNQSGTLSFADSAPFLLTTEASLTALNQQLINPVSMIRFRPNFVIAGEIAAWVEDDWRSIRIGEVDFQFYAHCKRCKMINIDPNLASLSAENQPLKILQDTHFSDKEPVFGIHLIAKKNGSVKQGDTVTVLR